MPERVRHSKQVSPLSRQENRKKKLFLQEVTEVTEKEEIEGYLLSPLPLLPPVQILVFCLLFSPWW
jgi:hypothetical protein